MIPCKLSLKFTHPSLFPQLKLIKSMACTHPCFEDITNNEMLKMISVKEQNVLIRIEWTSRKFNDQHTIDNSMQG